MEVQTTLIPLLPASFSSKALKHQQTVKHICFLFQYQLILFDSSQDFQTKLQFNSVKLAKNQRQEYEFPASSLIKVIQQFLNLKITNENISLTIYIQMSLDIQQKLQLRGKKKMNNPSNSHSESPNQVYGFLCQQTNVFYAFESYEAYQKFIEWMQSQTSTTMDSNEGRLTQQEIDAVSEVDQLSDFQRATREIMGIFNDPVFEKMSEEVQMQEVDF